MSRSIEESLVELIQTLESPDQCVPWLWIQDNSSGVIFRVGHRSLNQTGQLIETDVAMVLVTFDATDFRIIGIEIDDFRLLAKRNGRVELVKLLNAVKKQQDEAINYRQTELVTRETLKWLLAGQISAS